MTSRVVRTGLNLIALLLIGGCSNSVGPEDVISNGLRIQLEVTPSSIDRQETLIATLRLENTVQDWRSRNAVPEL